MLARVIRPIPKGAVTIPMSQEPIDVSDWPNVDTLIKLRYLEPAMVPLTADMLKAQSLPSAHSEQKYISEPSSVEPVPTGTEPAEVTPDKNSWSANPRNRIGGRK